jgi:hypothetical protein
MTDIPAHGWYIERDVDPPHARFPHRLWINGRTISWLTTEEADAFLSSEEKLPDGIRAGHLIDPDAEVPEGWERRKWGSWMASRWVTFPNGNDSNAVEARRIPVPSPPATKRVPWWEAVADKRTVVWDDGHGQPLHQLVATCAQWDGDMLGLSDESKPNSDPIYADADGTVEVLVE